MATDFQRDYPTRLPLPLAQLYSRAYHDKDARARHNNAFYLFEATTKLAAATAAAAYLQDVSHGAPRVPPLDRLLAHLALPSLGQWVALLRELARHFGTRPDAAAHPLGHLWGQLTQPHAGLSGLLALYRRIKNGPEGRPADDRTVSLLETLEALVQYRNAVFGHGAEREADFYEREMGPLLFPALNDLLADGVFDLLGPRGSRLVHITDLRLQDGGRVEVGLRELINLRSERTAPLLLASDVAGSLAPNRVAVLWPGRIAPLRLEPLLVYRESETADEVLFLNRGRNKQAEYLSYTTGRTERDRAMGPALAELLGRITGSAVSEGQLRDLAAHSLAETPSVERLFGTTPPATRLGDYEILGEIGRGGMGVVLLARQLSLGRLVALKMLPADLAGDEVALARFRREIRALSRCEHPNIVKVLTTGAMPDGQTYYAMEYVPGCDLEMVWRELSGSGAAGGTSRLPGSTWVRAVQSAARKRREETAKQATASPDDPQAAAGSAPLATRPPPVQALPDIPDDAGGYTARVAALVRDAALALQTVHEQGLVHRDVKPGNLMLTPDGKRIVLMDFGLAKGKGVATPLTRGGGFLGTLRYAAPEQLAAATLPTGPPADVRALGGTLWELLTRRRLFGEAEDEAQLAQKVHDEDVPRLRTIDPGFDRDLEAIVARATERRVADRIPTAGLLAEYLQTYLDGKPIPIRAPGPAEVVWRWVLDHKPMVGTVLAALVALAGVVLVSFLLIARSRDDALRLAGEKGRLAEENGRQARDMRALADRNGQLFRERAGALDRESRQRQRAEWQAYLGQMDKALLGLGYYRNDATREILERCRWDFRDWEHDYLSRQVDGARLIIERVAPVVNVLAYSGDGRWIVAGCGADVVVFDARTGARLFKGNGHAGGVTAVACAASTPLAITAGKDRVARVWDLNRPGKSRAFLGHKEPITCVAVSATGKWVATGDAGGTIIVWTPDTLKEVCRPAGPELGVLGLAIPYGGPKPDPPEKPMKPGHRGGPPLLSPGTDRLLSVDALGKMFWHDLPSGKVVKQEETLFGSGLASQLKVAWSRDGRRTAFCQIDPFRSSVAVRETAGGKWEYLDTPWSPKQVAFSPDGRWVAAVSDTRVCFFNTRTRVESLHLHTLLRTDVSAFAWSPDGVSVAAGSGGNLNTTPWPAQVGVWDVADDLERGLALEAVGPPPPPLRPGPRPVDPVPDRALEAVDRPPPPLLPVDAAVSADGRTLVVGKSVVPVADPSQSIPPSKGVIQVWSLPRLGPVPRRSWWTVSRVHGVAVSPDGSRVATAQEDHAARLWDAATGREERVLVGHTLPVLAVAFSPDGRRLATGGRDGSVRLWDARDGRLLRTLAASSLAVNAVAFSPDGRLLAAGGVDTVVRLWAVETGTPVGEMRRHGGAVNSLAFSPDGRLLVTGGADTTVRGWDVSSRAQLWVAKETLGGYVGVAGIGVHMTSVRKVLVTPSGRRIMSLTGNPNSTERRIRLWDAATGSQVCTLADNDGPLAVALSPDGQFLLGCRSDGGLKVWRAGVVSAFTPKVLKDQVLAVRGCAFSPDGRLVACASEDKSVGWYDLLSGQAKGSVSLDGAGLCVAFHPVREEVAHNQGERAVAIRPLREDAPARILEGHEGQVTALAYAPDGRLLATCGKDRTARLWDAQTGKAGAVLRGHAGLVSCLAFLSGGQKVVTGSWDETIRIWDVASGGERRRLEAPGEGVTGLVVTPDDRYLVAGGLDGSLSVWDLAAGTPPRTWPAHPQAVNALALLPDGRTVASGSADGAVRLWDVASGQNRGAVWAGGEGVLAMAVSRGRRLACGCQDGGTRLFDLSKLISNRHAVSGD